MAQEGPGADCGSDARPFLPLGRVVRIPFSDLEQERRQDCLGVCRALALLRDEPQWSGRLEVTEVEVDHDHTSLN
jgi:hypothetical protein